MPLNAKFIGGISLVISLVLIILGAIILDQQNTPSTDCPRPSQTAKKCALGVLITGGIIGFFSIMLLLATYDVFGALVKGKPRGAPAPVLGKAYPSAQDAINAPFKPMDAGRPFRLDGKQGIMPPK